MTDRVGQQLGNYRLTRLLGRGGFAEVYLGEHRRLKTQAAIKVLHTQLADSDVESFLKEAQFIANLEHPHIVRILDFDVEESTPFLVMSYAPNGTLRQLHPKDVVLPLPTVVSYIKQVADALQYAHDEKLIHRDIKPENMLLGRRNEILLSDFGIAIVAQSSRYQGTQDMAGTIAYMAPEQIQAHPRPASDQYSLAIVVYEWLTGERPFHGSFTEIAIKHSVVPPPPLREKLPTISPDVEQVVLTALAKDPKERFGNIQAFANALEQASHSDVPTFVNPPRLVVQPHHVETTSNPIVSSVFTPAIPPTGLVVPAKPAGTVLCIYRGHSARVNAVAWSPDGKYIASGGSDKTVQIWGSTTGDKVAIYRGHSNTIRSVAWSPDGSKIVSASEDRTAQVWNALKSALIFTYRGHSAPLRSVAWAPDSLRIASGGDDKIAHVWNANELNSGFIYYTSRSNYSVKAVAWAPDSTMIATGGGDWTVQIWQINNVAAVYTYRGHSNNVTTVGWSLDSRNVVSGSWDGTVQLWDATTGHKIVVYQGHTAWVNAVAWSPDNKRIASASDDRTVQIWDVSNGNKIFTYRSHTGEVKTVAWSPDGKHIASAGDDKTVQVWVAP